MNKVLEISAYTPTTHYDGKPFTADELKRMPEPYRFGPAVDKYRRLPKTPENIRAHGDAICAAVRSKQMQALLQSTKYQPVTCPCASGTWHTDGKALLKALYEQTRDAARNGLAESWRRRTDEQVGKAYLAAMQGKDTPLVHLI